MKTKEKDEKNKGKKPCEARLKRACLYPFPRGKGKTINN